MIERFATEVVARDEDGQQYRLPSSIRRHAETIDRHVGARIRGRRMMLGLTQQQMAALIGVTLQQASKYERGLAALLRGACTILLGRSASTLAISSRAWAGPVRSC